MDFKRPGQILSSSAEPAVLLALASADVSFTGHDLARRTGLPQRTTQNALNRLTPQGIVLVETAGRAKLYRLNRDHVAAPWIEGLAGLRQQLFDRIRDAIEEWTIPPVAAAVFGSVARGEAGPQSDLDLFLVRPSAADSDAWDEQVSALTSAITRWTGNDTRELEFAEDELDSAAGQEQVIKDVLDHGIEVGGAIKALRKLVRG